MPTGKHRNTKRSSGGSYTSTVTTVIFVCIFILGVWILTSNSYVSSNKSTNRLAKYSFSRLRSRKIPIDPPAFEDNPGDLPEDAIRPDDDSAAHFDPITRSNETKTRVESTTGMAVDKQPHVEKEGKDEVQMSEESTSTQNQSIQVVPTIEHAIENEDQKMKKDHREKKNDKQMNVTQDDKLSMFDNEEQRRIEEAQRKDKENEMQMNATGFDDEQNEVNNEEHHIPEDKQENTKKNDMQTYATGGNDKYNMAINEEQDISEEQENRMDKHQQLQQHAQNEETTKEEQENRMDKYQQLQQHAQNEETSKDDLLQNENKPIEIHPENETKRPIDEANINATIIEPNKDSKAVADTTMMMDQSSSGIPMESNISMKEWKTQAGQSENEKERRADDAVDHKWELCNVTSGTDYVPCLDNENAIKKLTSRSHFEHRERHCPEEGPMCLVPTPEGYKTPIPWPQSRDKIWFHNVPHKSLANIKGHQNWVKVSGELLTFPGGGTQFIYGALQYIDVLQQAVPEIDWGKHTRVVLDVGCGVASFGGYLFTRDVLTMSFAPNDEHESQIQFALERGIPAISAVMGTRRLPFPSNVFDLIHCARCRVPWHKEGGKLLLEINRLLRPGGYFVWSATPVYRKNVEDAKIWKEMSALTVAMCWELVTIKKDRVDAVDVAIYRKPESNECYNGRKKQEPRMCKPDDDPNVAWYIPLQACVHNIPIGDIERGSRWPEKWPARVRTPPYWLNKSQMGIYGKPAPDDFKADYDHWKQVVSKTYMNDLGFNWTNVRNVMDMRAVYGGFAAALKDLEVWVLSVVNTDSPDTLPIIFERGLFGIYHDWCESFSTYPRTYDLLHADHLFSMLKKRCDIAPVIVEVDRIVRPGGKLIVQDESSTIREVEKLLKSLHWDVHLTVSKNQEKILSAQKSTWRPDTYAIA